MHTSLALKNFKRSIKDYSIYFLTLTFGVCLFYVFNSVESQQAVLNLNTRQFALLESIVSLISVVSVFVAVILGFLVIYANRFLIKRRKKELGLYLLLGMERRGVAKILMIETVLIGIFSLGVGLLLGVFASQMLAVLTAKMFEVQLTDFVFVFSMEALIKTMLYFGLTFLIVILFNMISVSKYRLIDLFSASRRNERLRVKSIGMSVVLFLLSVVLLGAAYRLFAKNSLDIGSWTFAACLVLGTLGTFLFFLSLSGFLLRLVQLNKRMYYRGLNLFVLRQINAKITTAFVSISLICLMLLVAIGSMSLGVGYVSIANRQSGLSYPVDLTVGTYMLEPGDEVPDLSGWKDWPGAPEEEIFSGYHTVEVYESGLMLSDIVSYEDYSNWSHLLSGESYRQLGQTEYWMIPLSQVNNALKMRGEDPISLEEGEVMFASVNDLQTEIHALVYKHSQTLSLGGREYLICPEILEFSPGIQSGSGSTALVVPDSAVEGFTPLLAYHNFFYAGDKEEVENKITMDGEYFESFHNYLNSTIDGGYSYLTRISNMEYDAGTKTTISFLAIYIGTVFLITCAAVLALQQLSESSDNAERYSLLRKIGVEEREINHSLLIQVLIYFLVPLSLALVHSYVGVSVVNQILSQFGLVNALRNFLYTGGFVVLIYGGYLLATYYGSKLLIRPKKN